MNRMHYKIHLTPPQGKTFLTLKILAKLGFATAWIASAKPPTELLSCYGSSACIPTTGQCPPSCCYPKLHVDFFPIARPARRCASHNTREYSNPGERAQLQILGLQVRHERKCAERTSTVLNWLFLVVWRPSLEAK